MIRKSLVVIAGIATAATIGCTRKSDQAANGGATASSGSANEILVGEYGSFTGSEATFGISTSNGIKMALEEKNKAGGIKGKQIKLISLDNQGKAEEAAAAVTRLITQNGVIAVIGEVASSRSLAAAPIAQQNKIPMISPSSTNPKVTEVGDYIFRVCFIDPFQGTVMAKFARENLKAKRVAILRDVKSDYSVGLADYFISKFKELGGEIVSDQSYQSGEMDFKAQLTQIKGAKPDAVFVPGYYTEVGLIARQAKQLGLSAPLMGGDGWDSSKLYEIGGQAINGNYFSNHYTTESTDPVVVDFIKRYKEKYSGETPDGLAALGYDAARVLFEAMERTKDLKPSEIRDEIAKTKDFVGVTGKISMDPNRNASKPAVVVKVDGTTNRFVTTIAP
ncbi:MAG TPA: ABC transporter substrate-binding protein [Bdellovibrionales bacterium]|nr:ABC transporter substrate-binding protein [Bdellovibrionales bacterium]